MSRRLLPALLALAACTPEPEFVYGYRNVYELGPLIDLKASKLELTSR